MRYRTLAAIFFVSNGMTSIGMKAASEMPVKRSVFLALLLMNAFAAVFALVVVIAERKRLVWKNTWVGALGGIGSAVGGLATCRAAQMVPGYVVFPVSSGGTLLLIVLIARLGFKEKIGPYGIAGIAVGIAAITLLSF
jgi:drug/metabolite transporter (DMT)-like permease